METPEECPLERCPSPLSGLQIANSRPDHCRELGKNQTLWDAEISGYSLLSPQHQRLCLGQAFCSILLSFSPFHPALGITRSPPTPFKLISQPGDFKRLTNAWISNIQTGPSVVDNNRLWLQKWDPWARHRPRPMFCQYLLWAWPCAMLHICKTFPGNHRVATKGEGGTWGRESRWSRCTLKTGNTRSKGALPLPSAENRGTYWKGCLLLMHSDSQKCTRNPSLGAAQLVSKGSPTPLVLRLLV